jgi:hypothetical protein
VPNSARDELSTYVLRRAQSLLDLAEPGQVDDANAALALVRHIVGNSFLSDETACTMLVDVAARHGWDQEEGFDPAWRSIEPSPRGRWLRRSTPPER